MARPSQVPPKRLILIAIFRLIWSV